MAKGRFYGVGVGPGNPDHLTLEARRILAEVGAVCYPACAPSAKSYALRIVEPLLDPQRQAICGLHFPMSKNLAALEPIWRESARQIVEMAREGHDVAFITEGDSTLYSTFQHLHRIVRELDPEIPISIVPGVTSLSAAMAAAGEALAQQDERVAIVPATYDDDGHSLRALLAAFDTVVLMKVNSVYDRVLDLLRELGLTERAILVSRVGTADEIVTRDVESLRGQRLNYLSTLFVLKGGVA